MARRKKHAPDNGLGLPPADATYEYSAEELREFMLCREDPVYFIRNHMKIIHVDRGLVPFELYDFQEEMVRCYHENRFSITMCSRQVGKSTTVIGYFLWYILFNTNVRVCISANKQHTAAGLLGRLKLAYENLPRFLQHGVVTWAKLEIALANGSSCFSAATSSSAVRGGTYNMLLLDEFGFVPENVANEFYASTFPTITSGNTTKLIMVSTPNGMNLFHKFWTEANAKRNNFKPLFAHWSQVPGRDEQWKEQTIKDIGGPEKFAQEYECSFLSTSYTLIRPQVLQTLVHDDPVMEGETGYREYEPPDPTRSYLCCVDTSSGQGMDYSAFAIVDVTTLPYRVVATYANNRVGTMEFPPIIMEYAKRFFYPWMLVEVNDIGRDIALMLFNDREYPKLITTITDKRTGQRLGFGWAPNRHPGVRMTVGVKRSGCAVLKTLIEKQQLLVRDHRIIQELSVFVQRGSTYSAEVGFHDDLVMPLVMMGWASLQPNFAEITSAHSRMAYTEMLREDGDLPDRVAVKDEEPLPMVGNGWAQINDDDSRWLL